MRKDPCPAGRMSLALMALFILGAVPLAMAVEQTGDIAGRVLDEKRLTLPGAIVTVRGEGLQAERAALADKEGEFVFKALPPGRFSVEVRAPGYQSYLMEEVLVHVGRVTQLELVLRPGAQPETVRVVGANPPVDAVRTQTQDTYPAEQLEAAPISSDDRDYLSVVENSPGTAPGEDEEPSIRGSTRGQNLYLIDGVDSTDPATGAPGTRFIFDAIQEVQLQTGGFSAEYGRASGGILNVVTKSGGNELSGSLDLRFQNQQMIESGRHFDPGEEIFDHGIAEATIGGPVVKDSLWFFVAGSYLREDLGGEEFGSTRHFRGQVYLGKLTWQSSAQHRFVLQATADPTLVDNVDASPLTAAEASSKLDRTTSLVSAQYQGILGSDLIVQAQISHDWSSLSLQPQDGDLSTPGWVDFATGMKTRNATDAQASTGTRNQASASLTWNRPDLWGDHTFKFGFDIQDLSYELDQFAPGGEWNLVADDAGGTQVPLAYNVVRSAGSTRNTGLVQGYFAQDEWRIVPSFALNIGLRFEEYAYDNDEGRRVLTSSLLQPRAGLSWDVSGDAKTVVKLAGALYGVPGVLTLPRVANARANAVDLYVNETIAGRYYGRGPTPADMNGDGTIESRAFIERFGGPGGQVFARGGNLDATTVTEYTASVEQQLGASSTLGLALVHRETAGIVDNRFDTDGGIYTIDNRSDLYRSYEGAEIRFKGRWPGISIDAAYTWSKNRGNIEATTGLSEDFDFPVLSTRRNGWLNGDARSNLQTAGWFDLPWRLRVAWDFDWISGYPWTVVRPAFPYGLEFVSVRGAERLPAYEQLDLSLSRSFGIGNSQLRLVLSIQNVFGTEIVTEVNTSEAEQGVPLEWQIPRRYEIGARYTF